MAEWRILRSPFTPRSFLLVGVSNWGNYFIKRLSDLEVKSHLASDLIRHMYVMLT